MEENSKTGKLPKMIWGGWEGLEGDRPGSIREEGEPGKEKRRTGSYPGQACGTAVGREPVPASSAPPVRPRELDCSLPGH